ncbi:FAD dependent oxidoreductase [Aspergillus unguis]
MNILIIGAGTFGTSTAYHLSRRGYNITVLDKHAAPSIDAASTDISKIIRSDYNEPLYARLGIESIQAWSSWPLFKDLYHVPGWILSAANLSVPFVKGSIETCKKLGVKGLEILSTEEIRSRFPVVKGQLDGWNINVWNPTAGWAKAGEALKRMATAAMENGATYISGESGTVKELLFNGEECTGAVAADGTVYKADLVVLAAGAWTPSLLNVHGQLTAKGHSVAHIQLTPEERKYYSSFPIMDNLELGYFFPPQEDGTFKLAHSQFITNTRTDPVSTITTSIPHTFTEYPEDNLPREIEQTMRRNLRRVLPELAERPFSFTRLCWDADTADRHFLVTPHPVHKRLFLAAGGSAHGFKFLPVVGKYVADLLEGRLDEGMRRAWQWRAGQTSTAKNLAHMDPEVELDMLNGWKNARSKL